MTSGEAKAAALLLAIALALFASVGGDALGAQRKARQAVVSPPEKLCQDMRYGPWPDRELRLRWVIAHQADGGNWHHACAYQQGTYL